MAYTAWSVVFGEQPTAAKWNQLGSNDAGFKDGTNMDDDFLIGRHLSFELYRYVPIEPTSVLSADPNNANYNDLDVSAVVSANAYAVTGTVHAGTAGSSTRTIYMRKNGDTVDSVSNAVLRIPTAPGTNGAKYVCAIDASKILEWKVSNADVNALDISVDGYFETYTPA